MRSSDVRALVIVLGACGGAAPPADRASPPDEDTFGPLEVGADYATYKRLTDQPFLSLVHGNRWVDVFVNDIGAAAYESTGDIPVGTVVVKTSWIGVDGAPSNIAGPIFVMQKRAKGYAPEHDDWWYAIHWADPPPADRKKLGGPIYWRGKSKRAEYCSDCHDSYDRSLGGLIPSSILKR
jgi:hypothetical protein